MTRTILLAATAAVALAATPSLAAEYGPGVSDTEIKLGNTMPYSGPASAFGTIGKAIGACFDEINADGGINGRKITWISLDDGYSPPKTVEQTRKLVESEKVLGIVGSLGTPTSSAVHRYLNQKKVPQLFVASGASKWDNPEDYPWTMGWQPSYLTEAEIFGRYILENLPDAKIAILYQNDDYGKDYVKGLRNVLGDRADTMIVAEETYDVTDPTIDSQIVNLKNSDANVFYNVTTPKFGAQAIRKVADLNWDVVHLLNSASNSVATVLTPAGLDRAKGVISAVYMKDPTDPAWQDSPDYKEWAAFMKAHYADGDMTDAFNGFGYAVCKTVAQVIRQMGDTLTRENMMKQAANLQDLEVPMVLPGIRIDTAPGDHAPIQQAQLQRFDGKEWVRFGAVLSTGGE
ncbi:ABC transporter substrate-binding protein [Marinibaculum pumilum]|uniref:ABC transporter substrate-binding protein n=1 Tax=Marinibaculum pumilum TaxID=1766165 RepID=A0ABV7L1M4_9PROT